MELKYVYIGDCFDNVKRLMIFSSFSQVKKFVIQELVKRIEYLKNIIEKNPKEDIAKKRLMDFAIEKKKWESEDYILKVLRKESDEAYHSLIGLIYEREEDLLEY